MARQLDSPDDDAIRIVLALATLEQMERAEIGGYVANVGAPNPYAPRSLEAWAWEMGTRRRDYEFFRSSSK